MKRSGLLVLFLLPACKDEPADEEPDAAPLFEEEDLVDCAHPPSACLRYLQRWAEFQEHCGLRTYSAAMAHLQEDVNCDAATGVVCDILNFACLPQLNPEFDLIPCSFAGEQAPNCADVFRFET